MRVLVADDAAAMRALLKAAVSAAGHEVVWEASDAETAIALAVRERPGAIIVDSRLPPTGARDVVSGVRLGSPHTVIFVVAALAEAGLVDELKALGARAALLRPVRPAAIAAAFAQLA